MKPTSGEVYINGSQISGISSDIGYMLQNDNLLEWRTITRNVLFGLEIRKMLTQKNKEYAEQLLKNYGLYEFRDKHPSQLSGGMNSASH